MMRQLVGARLELAIAQRLILIDDRRGRGCARRLRGEQLMQAALLRIADRRVVPLRYQLMPLRLAQQRKLRHAPLRVRHDPFQQPLQMPRHPRDRRRIEQIRRILELALQPRRRLLHQQHQVELRHRALGLQPGQLQPGQVKFLAGYVLQ